jgi:hypothetical protein
MVYFGRRLQCAQSLHSRVKKNRQDISPAPHHSTGKSPTFARPSAQIQRWTRPPAPHEPLPTLFLPLTPSPPLGRRRMRQDLAAALTPRAIPPPPAPSSCRRAIFMLSRHLHAVAPSSCRRTLTCTRATLSHRSGQPRRPRGRQPRPSARQQRWVPTSRRQRRQGQQGRWTLLGESNTLRRRQQTLSLLRRCYPPTLPARTWCSTNCRIGKNLLLWFFS